ncbi:Mu-like prophage major head subunit gpT family protein [Paenibacillus sp. HN-1]|uniref:Mu-like prophage major head subunit gpT family protein n=2 Tax=Paenibacillus TaxID=44249 RepID=UPI001CA82C73|nr:Mu-like prophage major head subunit gpT family protein [Paenibacillus sp. CGMCC 1.18879]MBY9081202.1 Mu-like prophage major head subunit gpT family protein [Paenibacillus sp. CGMCC 1.18879]MBY9087239.1 Mu-like prophage major head subunit gpT family protein [Paenibacillus sinensis]
MPNPMQTNQFQDVFLKKIDRVFFEAYDEEPEQWSQYLNDKTSSQYAEIVQRYAGTTNWAKKNELVNPESQSFKLADLIVTNHQPWSIHIEMSRELYDDFKFNEVENMTKDAGHGARNTVETNSAQILDGAFTTNIYDGVPLISASHPNRGAQGGTQSNLASGPLNDTNLKAGIVLFRTQKDEGGKQIMQRPSKLVINQALQFTAAEVIQSALKSGTANNDANTLPALKIVDLLFTSSQTAWFLQANRHQMQHYWRVPVEFRRRPNMTDNMAWVWDGYFRDSYAIEDWRGIVGSTGL